jgi:hypothetical protein
VQIICNFNYCDAKSVNTISPPTQYTSQPTSQDLRVHPLEFVLAQPPKLHDDIQNWLNTSETGDRSMREEYLNDPLRSFSEEAEVVEVKAEQSSGSLLIVDESPNALAKTKDPILIIGEDGSGTADECKALSQRAYKKKVTIPRRKVSVKVSKFHIRNIDIFAFCRF